MQATPQGLWARPERIGAAVCVALLAAVPLFAAARYTIGTLRLLSAAPGAERVVRTASVSREATLAVPQVNRAGQTPAEVAAATGQRTPELAASETDSGGSSRRAPRRKQPSATGASQPAVADAGAADAPSDPAPSDAPVFEAGEEAGMPGYAGFPAGWGVFGMGPGESGARPSGMR